MGLTGSRRFARTLIAAAAVSAALAGGPLLQRPADAHISICYDDPILWLSNSHKVQISFALPNTTSVINSVTSIHYDIHIPAGATVTSSNDPSSPFTGKSTWTVYADLTSQTEYKVVGIVNTNTTPISTTLKQQVVLETNTGGGSSVTDSTQGYTNSWVTVDEPKAP